MALICYTFSTTKEFTADVKLASAVTWISIAVTSLAFLFGSPNGTTTIGLGRLRVLLALTAIGYAPGFFTLYRIYERDHFSPLTRKKEEQELKEDKRKANDDIAMLLSSPIYVFVYLGIFAQLIIFGVCIARLSNRTVVEATRFCG